MKDNQVFFNPFRLISPKLNAEASRLEEYELESREVTCLEEGLLVMISKLKEMANLSFKALLIADEQKMNKGDELAAEIHEEEKSLTNALVCHPATTADVLKAVLLFPGKLERCGDLLESVLNCARLKARDAVPFSDKGNAELTQLFGLLDEMFANFRSLLATLNPSLMNILLDQTDKVAQLTMDFALAHEDRLISGLCVPKASSLYLDILDSTRGIAAHVKDMLLSLKRIAEQKAA